MDESRFDQLAQAAFKKLQLGLDPLDADLVDLEFSGDMLTLTTADDQKCIINTQRAARQLWVAGDGEGLHFDYHETAGRWVDDRSRKIDLFGFVAEWVGKTTGRRVTF